MHSRVRACLVLAGFVALTVPLMPVQAVLLRIAPRLARRFPHWYHRRVCGLVGLTIATEGAPVHDGPVLIVANHVSWLDIVLLSAVAPVSFVAKKEVAAWPFVATLARLQRTVFVDRERRHKVQDTADEILGRLKDGDAIVLFAEGTSSDGNRVLAFKTSLFAAVKPPAAPTDAAGPDTVVQTVSIAYVRRRGVPLGWAGRRALGYYGDVEMGANAWDVLGGGSITAVVRIGPPASLGSFHDRKDLALHCEIAVREGVVGALRR